MVLSEFVVKIVSVDLISHVFLFGSDRAAARPRLADMLVFHRIRLCAPEVPRAGCDNTDAMRVDDDFAGHA